MKRHTLKARINELIRYPGIVWMISNDPLIKTKGNSLEEQDLNYVVRRYWKFKNFHDNLFILKKEGDKLVIAHIQNPGSKRYCKVVLYKDCRLTSCNSNACNHKTVDIDFTAAPYRSDMIDDTASELNNMIKTWITALEE